MAMKSNQNFGAMTVKVKSLNFPRIDISPIPVPSPQENLFIKNLTSRVGDLKHMISGKRNATGEIVHSFSDKRELTFYHVSTLPVEAASSKFKVTKLEIDDSFSTGEKITATRNAEREQPDLPDKVDETEEEKQPGLLDKMGEAFMKLPKAVEEEIK